MGADDRIAVYDTRTGKKLPNLVPRTWLRIFGHLSETPRQKATGDTTADVQPQPKAKTPIPKTGSKSTSARAAAAPEETHDA